jgi:hypothetical protein
MKYKEHNKEETPGILKNYYRIWDYLHAYAKRYRRAFYGMFTL